MTITLLNHTPNYAQLGSELERSEGLIPLQMFAAHHAVDGDPLLRRLAEYALHTYIARRYRLAGLNAWARAQEQIAQRHYNALPEHARW